MSDTSQAQMMYAPYSAKPSSILSACYLFVILSLFLDAQHTLQNALCMTHRKAHCVVCFSQAFHVKVPLLDLLAAYPAKLDLLNSVLADSGLSAEERECIESIKAIAAQQHAESGGGRLNYQLLFGLREPVRWHKHQKCAIGFHEGAQVCCAVLCCAVLCFV